MKSGRKKAGGGGGGGERRQRDKGEEQGGGGGGGRVDTTNTDTSLQFPNQQMYKRHRHVTVTHIYLPQHKTMKNFPHTSLFFFFFFSKRYSFLFVLKSFISTGYRQPSQCSIQITATINQDSLSLSLSLFPSLSFPLFLSLSHTHTHSLSQI